MYAPASEPYEPYEAYEAWNAPPRTAPRDENAALYASGAVIVAPNAGIHYARARLGPGNEAMAGGASPAPRGLTGGAMGKFIAGLSPSFAAAAMGEPAPGGPALYTPAEASATFGALRSAPPDAPRDQSEGAAAT
jgi:hypothetical protein